VDGRERGMNPMIVDKPRKLLFYRALMQKRKRDFSRVRSAKRKRSSTAQADVFVPQNHPGRKERAGAKTEEKVGLLRSE